MQKKNNCPSLLWISLVLVTWLLAACRTTAPTARPPLSATQSSPPATSLPGTIASPSPTSTATPQPAAIPTPRPTTAPAPDLGKLAYVSGGDIWVKVLPDGEPQRLTTDGHNGAPRWSPSGEWLAFHKGEQTWLVRADGSDLHPLDQHDPVSTFAWSPLEDQLAVPTADGALGKDGRSTVLWSSDGWLAWSLTLDQLIEASQWEQTLYLQPADGSAEVATWHLSDDIREAYYQLVDWVTGTRLILAGQGFLANSLWTWGVPLVTIHADTGEIADLGVSMLLTLDAYAWHPTQPGLLALAEGSSRYLNDGMQLKLLDVTTGELDTLTDKELAAFEPAWSPDGSLLTYAAVTASPHAVGDGDTLEHTLDGRAIYVVNPRSGETKQLTEPGDAVDGWPQWSADGTRLLYTRQHDGYTDVRVVALDGSSDELLTTGLADPTCHYGGCGWWRMLAYHSAPGLEN
jgi:hypothetical protein